MAGITFLTRYTMMALLDGKFSLFTLKFLNYIPVAILTSLIVPFIFTSEGIVKINNHSGALAIALLIAWRTKKVILVLLGGIVSFWLLSLLGR